MEDDIKKDNSSTTATTSNHYNFYKNYHDKNDKKNLYQDDATTNSHHDIGYDFEKNEEDVDDPSAIRAIMEHNIMISNEKRAWQIRFQVRNEQIKQQQQQKNKEGIAKTINQLKDDDDYCTIQSSRNRELHDKPKQMRNRLLFQQQQEQQYLEKETFIPTTTLSKTTAGVCKASHLLQ